MSNTWLTRAKRAAIAWGPQLSNPKGAILLAIMVVGGVVLRIQNVGDNFHFGFDEHQYVNAAHQFLIGGTDPECCHPPLSKIMVGWGMALMGNNPVGWRFTPLVCGLQSLVIAFLTVNALFKDRKAAWLAAAFMAGDGFYLCYSRSALGDILLSCLVQWSVFAAIVARGWAGVLTSALLIGLAASIKWVGLLAGIPACFAILLLKRAPWYTLSAFAIVPAVHLVVWMFGLRMIGLPNDPLSVWQTIMVRKSIHLGFPHETNPLESRWFTWPVMYHPILVKSARLGGEVRVASSLGNPLLWIAAHVGLLLLPIAGGAAALSARYRERWRSLFDSDSSKAVAILGVSWLSLMLLWMSGKIVTYWYHYLTCWGFAIMLVAGVTARLDRRYPKAVMFFVSCVFLVSVYYAPVWAELPLSQAAVSRRLPFPLWR